MTMVGRNMMLRFASIGDRLALGVVSIVVITTGVGIRASTLNEFDSRFSILNLVTEGA